MELLLQAITDELPQGSDLRYDDSYTLIESELDKLTSANETPVDWELVRRESFRLLTTQTKDIKLLTWWVYASLQEGALGDFVAMVEVVRGVLQKFHKAVYPASNKTKLNGFIWFENVLRGYFVDGKLYLQEEAVVQLLECLVSIQGLIAEICDTPMVLFRDHVGYLQTKVDEVEKKKQQAHAQEQKEQKSQSEGISDIQNDRDALQILNEVKKKMENLGKYWRSQNCFDLRAVRFVRVLSWLDLDGIPPSQSGKTMLNPPSAEKIELIDTLIANKEYAEAIEAIEGVLIRSPFWFAGHYKIFEVFTLADKPTEAKMIKEMVLGILRVYDELVSLAFRDGSMFVPLCIQEWLAEMGCVGGAQKTSGDFEIITEQSRELLRKKEIRQSMQLVQDTLHKASSKEERFRWRLFLAEIANEASKPLIALAIVDDLEVEIQKYNLVEWRPDLASAMYVFVLQTFNKAILTKEKFEYFYNQLSRINPALAVEIKI